MTIIIDGTTGVPVSPVTGTLAVANGGTGVTTSTGSGANVLGTSPSISGAVMTTMASSVITSGTAQASTSGTSIDFSSIPSWVKRITVMFNGVSTNGSSPLQVQLGSGSVQTTSYRAICSFIATSSAGSSSFTSGFATTASSASNLQSGSISFVTSSSANYQANGILSAETANYSQMISGSVTLGGTLDRVRITTVNGTDTFDAGSINILYE